MTIAELLAREAIRDCLARYNMAGDRLQAEAFAACFMVDGVLQSERGPDDVIFRYEGREAIRAWQDSWRDRTPAPDTARGASFVRHHLTTSHIALDLPDTATARTYWSVWSDIGPDHAGLYLDDLRCVDGEWLIARRRVRRDWNAADSLFVPAEPAS